MIKMREEKGKALSWGGGRGSHECFGSEKIIKNLDFRRRGEEESGSTCDRIWRNSPIRFFSARSFAPAPGHKYGGRGGGGNFR